MESPTAAAQSDTTRAIVTSFLDILYGGDIAGSFALIADDGVWLFPGDPSMISLAGERPKAAAQAIIEEGFARFSRLPTCRIRKLIVEGADAAVEADMDGQLANGNEYKLIYIFFFRVENGKITRIHEHLDTYYGMRQMFEKSPITE